MKKIKKIDEFLLKHPVVYPIAFVGGLIAGFVIGWVKDDR